MTIEASIAADAGTRGSVVVPRSGPETVTLELPIPEEIEPGQAIDLLLSAERGGVLNPRLPRLASVYVVRVTQSS